MSIPRWSANTLEAPGAFILPKSSNIVIQRQPDNNSFTDGLTHWTQVAIGGTGAAVASTAEVFDTDTSDAGSCFFAGALGTGFKNSVTVRLFNSFLAPVNPGRGIMCSIELWRNTTPSASSACDGSCGIQWLDSSMDPIGGPQLTAQPGGASAGGWSKRTATFYPPANAAYAQYVVELIGNTSGAQIYADNCLWDYTYNGLPSGFVFVAVQAAAGLTGNSEPVWPTELGGTVTDGAVTWEAEDASKITWIAEPICFSGATEPNFPTTVGASVVDNTCIWTCVDGRVQDTNCPQSKVVAIAAAKIFAGDDDIIAFSATTNPLDWTTQGDAGFLPFGLQNYGNEPVAAMGLYRSNLVAFNSIGYQMWQIDPNPDNMALLDASPVGCPYSKSVQPVNSDLAFLSAVGIRTIGIAGASTNLQAGQFGKQVDPLVLSLIQLGYEPKGLFLPGTGQYMLFFGSTAMVLTMNGGATQMSWSRYVFPDVITDWTILDGVLYLRDGVLVWQFDASALTDDVVTTTGYCTLENGSNVATITDVSATTLQPGDSFIAINVPNNTTIASMGTSVGGLGTVHLSANATATVSSPETFISLGSTDFDGYMAWPYLDFGNIGLDKQLEGFSLVVTGNVTVSIGTDQADFSIVTDSFEVDGDTLGGIGMIPFPVTAKSLQFRLDFGSNQYWQWNSLISWINTEGST
jgi:hypothetical protein